MPIPPLTSDGWLPAGEHACSLDQLREIYVARFSASQTRPAIFSSLRDHLGDPEVRQNAQHVLLDGSFVSSKVDPGDADLILGCALAASESP